VTIKYSDLEAPTVLELPYQSHAFISSCKAFDGHGSGCSSQQAAVSTVGTTPNKFTLSKLFFFNKNEPYRRK
jgi:hypothetical protein